MCLCVFCLPCYPFRFLHHSRLCVLCLTVCVHVCPLSPVCVCVCARACACVCVFSPVEGGDVLKLSQLAALAGGTGGSQGRVAQPETPVTLQFQGNKFTLSPSQLRQLTTGQPLQLQ